MKSLTVWVLCSLCCVKAYRIFPLPGQNVESNSKFGNLGLTPFRSGQATKTPEVISRLASFTPRASFSVKSGTQLHTEENTTLGNFVRPLLSTARSVPSTLRSTVSVTTQASRLEGSTRKPHVKSTFGTFARPLPAQAVVPSTTQTSAVKILNRPASNNQASTFIQKPQNFAVEPPANDLLPPKENSKPGLPIKVTTVRPRPTVAAPFNDLLPPKTS